VNDADASFPFPSVTVTAIVYVPPELGVQLNDTAVLLHPAGNPDHAYVYVPGPVPPVAPVVEIVVAWFASTGFGVAEAIPADNAGSTVKANDAVAVFPFPSVTVRVTVYGLPECDVGLQLNDAAVLLHPAGSPVHAYVYVPAPVPPVAPLVEIVVVWFTSTGFTVAEAVPADSAESTVNANVVVAVFPFPSVTVNVTVNGDPVVSLGVQMIELEFDDVHPSGRFVHA